MSDPLLDQLEALKGRFGEAAAARIAELLDRLKQTAFSEAAELVRFHETALFLRAYPASSRVRELADEILFGFASRITDPNAFDGPEASGMAGTTFAAVFSHEVTRRLLARYGKAISACWEGYQPSDTFGAALAHRIPLFSDDWPVEAHVPFLEWMGRRDLDWLLRNVNTDVYEALRLPVEWRLGSSPATRSCARWPGRNVFYHKGSLLKRADVSLEAELAAPPLPVRRLAPDRADRLLDLILANSAVRYRELYGFSWPDRRNVLMAEAGRGLEICFFGVPPERRLPLRAYHCGMFFKNGVPAGYVETLSLFERAEVGFNLYYTFREGETAWIYARMLRLLRQLLGVTAFSVDPYQVGHHNEEAIESGAFWFYRKLGFRPLSEAVTRMAAVEEARMKFAPEYRTPARRLRRMAESGLIYNGGAEWDAFSVRQLGLRVSRSLEGTDGWPAVLSRIRDYRRWTAEERRGVEKIIQAKTAREEWRYLRLLQGHARLRAAVLKLGSG